MTVGEIIDYVDGVKPNSYEEEEKIQWINELENSIEVNVYDKAEDFTEHESTDEELLLDEVWKKLYVTYLEARIASANGEFNEYANLIAIYNGFVGEFQNWYCRHFVDID